MSVTDQHFPKITPYKLDYTAYLSLNKSSWKVKPARVALLIYDMQAWYVGRYEDPTQLITNIQRLRTAVDAVDAPTIFAAADPVTHVAERGIARDLWGDGIGAVRDAESADDEMYPGLRPTTNNFVIRKRKYSAFFDTDLEALLRRMDRSQVILCGNYANHGCMVTAVEAYMRNFKVFFVADALGAFDAASHDLALRWVADTCGQITLTADLEVELFAVHI